MSARLWRVLLGESLATRRKRGLERERVKRQLRAIRRRRRLERKARMRAYAIGWCHSMALKDDRIRTIRLELERQHLNRKVVRFMQAGLVG